ncbi:hypothetical protein DICSQDRAFT_166387 [Dichomitus squalens LYAD-421 SS1]|uniref:uncharacterized protein n=1 Tax=Dichomitus squalens (strain LYAD-421) TaxID=732165 RepID=UPI0004411D68|nr:uncharacterized protein DICSQDRAFT_166387 [Dichomitus squalens LYAD-421 SS1]EJF65350.1 hypothetical protein DICSQDRAFT_166387 [Dichomitus squalens LYAD-421 SS1]
MVMSTSVSISAAPPIGAQIGTRGPAARVRAAAWLPPSLAARDGPDARGRAATLEDPGERTRSGSPAHAPVSLAVVPSERTRAGARFEQLGAAAPAREDEDDRSATRAAGPAINPASPPSAGHATVRQRAGHR